MAERERDKPWKGMSKGVKPKWDYDDDEFYDLIYYHAFAGASDTEIAAQLGLEPNVFGQMKNGNYFGWDKEKNDKRSLRICRVLTRARENINQAVRGRFLKAALGGIVTKSRTIRYIKGQEGETMEVVQETETELPPNMNALSKWLYHRDKEYRLLEQKIEQAEGIPQNIEQGVNIAAWIEDHVVVKGRDKEKDKS